MALSSLNNIYENSNIGSTNSDIVDIGIGGFRAMVRLKEQTTYTCDSPDIPIEDGSYIQDHIINKPIVLDIDLVVGDVWLDRNKIISALKTIDSQITNIDNFIPIKTTYQLQQISKLLVSYENKADKITSYLNSGNQLASLLGYDSKNLDSILNSKQENQSKFIDFVEVIYNKKIPISIEMPTRIFNNMVIISANINKNNEKDILYGSITAKQILISNVLYSDTTRYFSRPDKKLKGQLSNSVNKGIQRGKDVEKSLAKGLLDFAKGISK